MAKIYDDVKKFFDDWWNRNGPKVEDAVKTTAEKAENLTQKARLNYDLYQARRDLTKGYEKLGKKVYQEIKEHNTLDFSTDNEFQEIIDQIKGYEKKIQDIKDEISKIGKVPEEESSPEEENPADIIAGDVPDIVDEKKER
ncbi:MAG: hypothetical protein PHS99_00525 [Candidatus Marinimicrobia bacterium]|nr:hypothetical protein [Candidatus Neomarinimicrobiota bacterium]